MSTRTPGPIVADTVAGYLARHLTDDPIPPAEHDPRVPHRLERVCLKLLEKYGIETSGKKAVVIGRSLIVGRPMSTLLSSKGVDCTVTICHSKTRDLPGKVRAADIVVAGVGRPNFVSGDWIKEGAIVIDVGINRIEDGTLVGDVDFHSARERAAWITPVPGGVGPMTIATLLRDPDLRSTMALASRERAVNEFGYDVLAARLGDAIDAMVKPS